VRALLPAAALLVVAPSAWGQSSGCDQFKDKLAARIDPGIRGFTLDIVPAGAPLPAGAKVFGTCDAGAFKILFRRGGSTRPSPAASGAASAAASASAPPASVVPATAPAAAAAAAPRRAPNPPVVASAVAARPATEAVVAAAKPLPVQPDSASEAQAAPWQQASEFMAGRWPWLGVLLALPFAGWIWVWYARRRAYDEAGLPRGPKL